MTVGRSLLFSLTLCVVLVLLGGFMGKGGDPRQEVSRGSHRIIDIPGREGRLQPTDTRKGFLRGEKLEQLTGQ